MRMPRAALEQAYRNTTYWVDDPEGSFGIRLDEACARLDVLLAAHGVDCWAYVTAWNPRSQLLQAALNAARHAKLRARIAALGFAVLTGRSQPDSADWAAEESLLVLGMDEAAALALGKQFGQHAVVAGVRGGVAGLCWCDSADE
jgi:hypothetical protein